MEFQGSELYFEPANDAILQYIPVLDFTNAVIYDTDFPIVCEHEDIPYQENMDDQDVLDHQILYGHIMYADSLNQQIMHVQDNDQVLQEIQVIEDIDDDALQLNQKDNAFNDIHNVAYDVIVVAEQSGEDNGLPESETDVVNFDSSSMSFHSDVDLDDDDSEFWPDSDRDSGILPI